jgi:starch phosphorylase
MRPMFSISVVPSLPPNLQALHDLAYNVWWTWNPEAIELFRRLDREAWEESGHDPVRMLDIVDQVRLESAATDDAFLAHLERVSSGFLSYMGANGTWFQRNHGDSSGPRIAYFCLEYGLTESIPIYSGGMGVLAGDYLKSASDLGVPLVAVGLAYQQGYFRQYLNANGWQGELYPENDFSRMPMQLEVRDGVPLTVELPYPDRRASAQIWRVQVGRVPLYLLDSNLPQNHPDDRHITYQLYGGDAETRIRQEIMLGIGGVRALRALGMEPQVFHMNEGHAAFLAVERMQQLVSEHGLTVVEAKEVVCASNIFTTHTSVSAGIDLFDAGLVERYLSPYYGTLGISRSEFLSWGREFPTDEGAPLNMLVLALRLAGQTNAVSQLHGEVSRKLWRNVWPGVPEREVPIVAINNGVHTRSWISQDLAGLLERYLGPRWTERPSDQTVWNAVDDIPDEELWRVHERRRARLVAFARRRLRKQLEKRGSPPAEIAYATERLDPEALTIGFARRFAVYKRATLLLRHPQRLAAILTNRDRPVQVIVSGKAHPKDNPAKEIIRQLIHLTRENGLANVVFIEDYDMNVARYLVQGADLWLNTPVLMREASGTSGMKASANGVLNLSVLDGWWAEAYHPDIGWAIGRGEVYEDRNYQDEVESNALYDLLEKEIVPLFYNRASDGLPRGWIRRMKDAMHAVVPIYNTNRMVIEYTERLYRSAERRFERLSNDGFAHARALGEWKASLHQHWPEVQVVGVETDARGVLSVGTEVEVRASMQLGHLRPEDVLVETYEGALDPNDEIADGRATPMAFVRVEKGLSLFVGRVRCESSGRRGCTVRVLPRHEDLAHPFEPRLIVWGA